MTIFVVQPNLLRIWFEPVNASECYWLVIIGWEIRKWTLSTQTACECNIWISVDLPIGQGFEDIFKRNHSSVPPSTGTFPSEVVWGLKASGPKAASRSWDLQIPSVSWVASHIEPLVKDFLSFLLFHRFCGRTRQTEKRTHFSIECVVKVFSLFYQSIITGDH